MLYPVPQLPPTPIITPYQSITINQITNPNAALVRKFMETQLSEDFCTVNEFDSVVESFVQTFWNTQDSTFYKSDKKSDTLDFWLTAHVWEFFIDYYDRIRTPQALSFVHTIYQGFIDKKGNDWKTNTFNDDIMWWVLSCLKAYTKTNDKTYLDQAKVHLDWMLQTQFDNVLGGGIWWKNDTHEQKNSCIVCPSMIACLEMYLILKDDKYLNSAIALYNWQRSTLFDIKTGQVFDHISKDKSLDKRSFTYNQGTFMGAAVRLFAITNKKKFLEDAIKAAEFTKSKLCSKDGILKNEGQGDGGAFKLIFVRYLFDLINIGKQSQYLPWMITNGESVWSNRRSAGSIMGFDWAAPTPDTGVEAQSALGGLVLLNLLLGKH